MSMTRRRSAGAVLALVLCLALPSTIPAACRGDCKAARRVCVAGVRDALELAKQECAASSSKRACRAAARSSAKSARRDCRDAWQACRGCCKQGGTSCATSSTTTTSSSPSSSTTVTTSSTTTTTLAVCGDGVRQAPELCDDGNAEPADGCRSDCTPTPCPSGILDPHDGCDISSDGCEDLPPTCDAVDAACTLTAEEVDATVAFLADDAQEGRNNQTPASVRVQEFLIDQLQTFALPAGSDGFREPFAQGTNLLASVPGSDPSATETIVIGAHYDHLGASGATVYNGATDNAAGVAAVLAVGRAIARQPLPLPVNVLLALWDAEEDGLLGSKAYVASPRVPIADTVAYINMDIIGANVVRGFRRSVFLVGVDTSSQFLALLDDVEANLSDALIARRLSAIFGQGRSDYQPFIDAGVPTLFFSDTTGGCYHTPADDLGVVHVGKVLRTAWIVYNIVQQLGFDSNRPTFRGTNLLPTYGDAISLKGAFLDGLCDAAASGLTPANVTQVGEWIEALDAILAPGAGAFDDTDAVNVGVIALDAVSLLTSLPCQAN